MLTNLLKLLNHEKMLMSELVILAEKQQKSLIKYNIFELEQITLKQVEITKSLKEIEEQRIKMLMSTLNISRIQASVFKLSGLENFFKGEEIFEIKKMKLALKSLISKLQALNMMNRVLANRARNSVQEMLHLLSNGANRICNVII